MLLPTFPKNLNLQDGQTCILVKAAAGSSKTLVTNYQTTRRHTPKTTTVWIFNVPKKKTHLLYLCCQYYVWVTPGQIHSWEADSHLSRSATRLLWNPKVHYHIQIARYLTPFETRTNPVHTLQSYLIFILLFSHIRLGIQSGLSHSGKRWR
jgi:hypothetical protein